MFPLRAICSPPGNRMMKTYVYVYCSSKSDENPLVWKEIYKNINKEIETYLVSNYYDYLIGTWLNVNR